MADHKRVFLEILDNSKEILEGSFKFYRSLEENSADEDRYQFNIPTELYDPCEDLFSIPLLADDRTTTRKKLIEEEFRNSSEILRILLDTINEYHARISAFTESEFSAFLLGLGATWIPIKYSGIDEMRNYRTRIKRAQEFYRNLNRSLEAEGRQGDTPDFPNPFRLHSRFYSGKEMKMTELLETMGRIADAFLETLGEK